MPCAKPANRSWVRALYSWIAACSLSWQNTSGQLCTAFDCDSRLRLLWSDKGVLDHVYTIIYVCIISWMAPFCCKGNLYHQKE